MGSTVCRECVGNLGEMQGAAIMQETPEITRKTEGGTLTIWNINPVW